jgi:hypothetical protein
MPIDLPTDAVVCIRTIMNHMEEPTQDDTAHPSTTRIIFMENR